jgi:hypothetical protein
LDAQSTLAAIGGLALVFGLVLGGFHLVLHDCNDPVRMASHENFLVFALSLWSIDSSVAAVRTMRRMQLLHECIVDDNGGVDTVATSGRDGGDFVLYDCGHSVWLAVLQTRPLVLLAIWIGIVTSWSGRNHHDGYNVQSTTVNHLKVKRSDVRSAALWKRRTIFDSFTLHQNDFQERP